VLNFQLFEEALISHPTDFNCTISPTRVPVSSEQAKPRIVFLSVLQIPFQTFLWGLLKNPSKGFLPPNKKHHEQNYSKIRVYGITDSLSHSK